MSLQYFGLHSISGSLVVLDHVENAKFDEDLFELVMRCEEEYGIDAKISVVADPSIEEGGCVLETNNGIVDASIDTQIEIIKKALEGIG